VAKTNDLWHWSRGIFLKDEDAWRERLNFVNPDQLVFSQNPKNKLLKVEVYSPRKELVLRLRRQFLGKIKKIKISSWIKSESLETRVNGSLSIISSLDRRKKAKLQLWIPTGMAFGSGSHATTGMILKYLGAQKKWDTRDVLDIGTGSGILALTIRALGGKTISGIDFDPTAVRVARENEKANFESMKVHWAVGDVLKWKFKKKYDLILANLFSELLIQARNRIWKHLSSEGQLILSGILTSQEKDVVDAFKKLGGVLLNRRRKGKWIFLVFERGRKR
jgi:ribosomal protein L11 methyltransferase